MPGGLLLITAAAAEDAAWRFRLATAGGAAMLLAVAVHTIGSACRRVGRVLGSPPAVGDAAGPSRHAAWPEVSDAALDVQPSSGWYHLRLRRRSPSPPGGRSRSSSTSS
jgi:hypothetical protein